MDGRLTIPQAGRRALLSYNQVLRLVMLGQLTGGQDANGRWWVSAGDVERLAQQRDSQPLPAA
jgi:hypothetical protein